MIDHGSNGSGTHLVRSHRTARVWLASLVLSLGAGIAGCETESAGEVVSYVDSAGRSCSVDTADISQTSTCDADPSSIGMCTAGAEAAFVVHDDYDFETEIYTLRSCGACIDRAERTSFIVSATCATVECEADIDCLYGRYTCTSGICQHE